MTEEVNTVVGEVDRAIHIDKNDRYNTVNKSIELTTRSNQVESMTQAR